MPNSRRALKLHVGFLIKETDFFYQQLLLPSHSILPLLAATFGVGWVSVYETAEDEDTPRMNLRPWNTH